MALLLAQIMRYVYVPNDYPLSHKQKVFNKLLYLIHTIYKRFLPSVHPSTSLCNAASLTRNGQPTSEKMGQLLVLSSPLAREARQLKVLCSG